MFEHFLEFIVFSAILIVSKGLLAGEPNRFSALKCSVLNTKRFLAGLITQEPQKSTTMGRRKKQSSVEKTLRENEAMINYAMAKGEKLPPHVLAAFERFKLYQDFKKSLSSSNNSNESTRSVDGGAGAIHPFLTYSQDLVMDPISGRPATRSAEEIFVPSEEEMIHELTMVHQDLTAAIYPATPSTIVMLEDQKKRPLRFLGPVPLIQRMTFVAIISLLTFLGLFMFEEVSASSVNGNILDYEDPMTFLLNELFILSIAAAGASFYALFEAYKYISNASFDSKYESMYWIRFILGILSGVILAQFIFIDPAAYGGNMSETTTTSQSLGGFITYKPILAFLGGFSARVVHKILNSLVDSLETFISGSARDMLRAREESAKVQMEERISNMKRENAVNDATNRFNEAIRLMELQKQLGKGGNNKMIEKELEAMIQSHLNAINGGGDIVTPNLDVNHNSNNPGNNYTNPAELENTLNDLGGGGNLGNENFPGDLKDNRVDEIPSYEDPLPPVDEGGSIDNDANDGLDIDFNPDDIPMDPPPFKD